MYNAPINTSNLPYKGFIITVEVYPNLIFVSTRLRNGSLFKFKYIDHSQLGALEDFKEKLKCL